MIIVSTRLSVLRGFGDDELCVLRQSKDGVDNMWAEDGADSGVPKWMVRANGRVLL